MKTIEAWLNETKMNTPAKRRGCARLKPVVVRAIRAAVPSGLLLCSALPLWGAPPANDNFADRIVLRGAAVVVRASTAYATREPEEPAVPELPAPLEQTVWWSWTAPIDGLARIVVAGLDFQFAPAGVVFTGTELSQLTFVTSAAPSARFPVRAGTTYQIAVGGDTGTLQLGLVASAPLPNDDFTNRVDLGSANVRVAGSNRIATVEPGEPFPPGDMGGTVWWSWTAPVSGPVHLTVEECLVGGESAWWGFYPTEGVDVFTGGDLTNLTLVPLAGELQRIVPALIQLRFDAIAGTTYHVRVHGLFGVGGRFTVNLAQTLVPALFVTHPVPNTNFVAGAPVRLAAQAFDSDGSVTRVDFYVREPDDTGGLHPPWGLPVASLTSKPFVWETNLPPGAYDFTALATDDAGAKGLSIPISFVVRPANDDFAQRIGIEGALLSIAGSGASATREPGEPTPEGGSVWWSWTAPASGSYTITAPGYAFLDIYQGSAVTNLVRVARGETQSQGDFDVSRVVFSATSGTAYAIRVISGYGFHLELVPSAPPTVSVVSPTNDATFFLGDMITLRATAHDSDGTVTRVDFYLDNALIGSFTNPPFEMALTLTNPFVTHGLWVAATDNHGLRTFTSEAVFRVLHPPPANDNFADRILLTGASLAVTGSLVGATIEPGETTSSGGSAWWSWVAPASGTYTITVVGEGYDPFLGIYQGAQVSNLVLVASDRFAGRDNSFAARVVLSAAVGTTYALAVAGGGEADRPVDLRIAPTAPPTVRIASPTNYATFLPSDTITLRADATDDDAISRVDFYLNYELTWSLTNPPYAVAFIPTNDYVNANVNYQLWAVATDNHGVSTRSDEISFNVIGPRPPNDSFADRIILAGSSLTVTGVLDGVTREPGDPSPGAAWWSWTAPTSGPHTISAVTVGFYPFLGIYTGAQVSNLVLVASDWFDGTDDTYEARVVLNATAGTTYALAVASGGTVTLSIVPTVPPTVRITSPTNNATFVEGETITLTADASDSDGRIGRVDFYVDFGLVGSVTNPPFVLPLPLRNGHVTHRLRAAATDNDGVSTLSDEVWFTVLYAPPANDHFARRGVLTGALVTVAGSVFAATLEPDEPWVPGFRPGSVWWAWTAPASGAAVLRGGEGLEVYTGSSLTSLVLVARVGGEMSEDLHFPAAAGTEYQIRLGLPDGQAWFQLSLLLDAVELSVLEKAPDGAFSAKFRATLERLWRIEASTDLTSWIPIASNLAVAGWLELADRDAAHFPRRFYRFRPQP